MTKHRCRGLSMDQLKKICNVKVWLIILAVIHTVVGVLANGP